MVVAALVEVAASGSTAIGVCIVEVVVLTSPSAASTSSAAATSPVTAVGTVVRGTATATISATTASSAAVIAGLLLMRHDRCVCLRLLNCEEPLRFFFLHSFVCVCVYFLFVWRKQFGGGERLLNLKFKSEQHTKQQRVGGAQKQPEGGGAKVIKKK